MHPSQKNKKGIVTLLLVVTNAIVLEQGFVSNRNWYWLLVLTAPLLLISIFLRGRF